MSLFDKFEPLRALQAALRSVGNVPWVSTPMDEVHSATSATIHGRRVVLAGTNNYLGLTFDERCRAAAIHAGPAGCPPPRRRPRSVGARSAWQAVYPAP